MVRWATWHLKSSRAKATTCVQTCGRWVFLCLNFWVVGKLFKFLDNPPFFPAYFSELQIEVILTATCSPLQAPIQPLWPPENSHCNNSWHRSGRLSKNHQQKCLQSHKETVQVWIWATKHSVKAWTDFFFNYCYLVLFHTFSTLNTQNQTETVQVCCNTTS